MAEPDWKLKDQNLKDTGYFTQEFRIDKTSKVDGKKKEHKTSVSIDTEDIIAIFAGLVAVAFAVAMIAGWVPINKLTVGLASFSGIGAVIAKIVKSRQTKAAAKPDPEDDEES
jgi:hypothetical protein